MEPQAQKRSRSTTVDDPRTLGQLLRAMEGEHEAEIGHRGGPWVFSIILGSMAALWVPWLVRDLLGADAGTPLVGLLAVAVGGAVLMLFFVLKTSDDRYLFDGRSLKAFSPQNELRWEVASADVIGMTLVRVRGHRFFIYLHLQDGSRRPIHSHESLAKRLREPLAPLL